MTRSYGGTTNFVIRIKSHFAKVRGDCPAGFESLGMSCFVVLNVKGSYAAGQKYCEMVGASLAVIRSQDEEALIDGYLRRNISQIQEDQIWIGGTDLLQEGTFLVPGTQEVLTYFNWAPGQPDNYGRGEHCLDIFRDDAQLRWNDQLCNTDRVPLCQREQIEPPIIVG
ncbi:perlucin-like isoform X1 [Dreissena polymorpha]|uniref:perlucin-like isoform X1 n=1 Tax=Dreissena polymorpha TaxID=45954 RepID=UPI0022643EC3|nr:perlucin-like isoform X1 [Dreissena polymorpha]XP_052252960.1 perlucin-like isoform X1 [Dreissena polymorpha]XP_052252961.1 perlucin-like isoform X1 [Dreissena polymorpha]